MHFDHKSNGARIRHLRIRRGLTQEQLAEKIDSSSVYIGYVERGLQCPTIYQFLKIANALNINIKDFFKDFLD